MCHAHNEKWKKTNNRRNGPAKSRKNQNTQRKGKSHILMNIGNELHQTSRDEKNKTKDYFR